MSKFKFELNRAGVRELMRSDAMKDIVAGHAQNAQRRLGSGYDTDTYVGKNRVNAMVFADTEQAVNENSENNSLLKAVHK